LSNIFAISDHNQFRAVFPALSAVAYLQPHVTGEQLAMGQAVPARQYWISSLQQDNSAGTRDEVLTREWTLS